MAGRYFLANLSDAFLEEFAALIKDVVGLVYGIDGLARETAAAQSDEVETTIGHGVAGGHAVGRDVLSCARTSAHHHVAADVAELVNEHGGTDDGKIVHDNLARKFGGIADDAAIANQHIVSHVHSLHKEVVAAHNGTSFGSGAAVDGHILADGIVVAHFSSGFLAAELEVLRDGTDDGTREDGIAAAHARAAEQGDAIHQCVVVANDYVLVDKAEGANLAVFADDGLGMDVG